MDYIVTQTLTYRVSAEGREEAIDLVEADKARCIDEEIEAVEAS